MPIGHRVVFVVIGTHISPPKKNEKGDGIRPSSDVGECRPLK